MLNASICSQAVLRVGCRCEVTGSIHDWSRSHLTYYVGWLLARRAQTHFAVALNYSSIFHSTEFEKIVRSNSVQNHGLLLIKKSRKITQVKLDNSKILFFLMQCMRHRHRCIKTAKVSAILPTNIGN